MNAILTWLNDFLYIYILVALLTAAGIYFTVVTKGVQFRLLKEGLRTLTEKKASDRGISSFQALMISTASRVGTGNIIGVSTAIAVGGPGAVFWMWLMALLGAASAFCESTLAQIYKIKSGDKFLGGPAYYIQRGLGKKGLGVLYAVLLIICSSTAMILLVSGVEGNAANAGSPYMQQAVFHMFGETGIHIVTVALMLFAFTTLLGNYFYAEQNLKFITENSKALFVFRIVALVIIFIGTHVGFEMAWNITDILMALVAIVNILAVFAMRRPVIAALKNYDKARKTTDEPVFRAADIGLTDTDCWK